MDHNNMNMEMEATTTGDMDHGTGGHGTAGHGNSFIIQAAATILFRGWRVDTWQEMLGSCVAVAAVACAYEGFKLLRDVLLRRSACEKSYPKSRCAMMCSGMHMLQTLLYMVQVLVSFCLMMVFMTFNLWLCMAIVIGAGIGYFFFGFRRLSSIEMDDHCQ